MLRFLIGADEWSLPNVQNCSTKKANLYLGVKITEEKHTSICVKSAPPTPTIRIDRGRSDALTKESLVSCISVITPS
jgi:hypothetical protein